MKREPRILQVRDAARTSASTTRTIVEGIDEWVASRLLSRARPSHIMAQGRSLLGAVRRRVAAVRRMTISLTPSAPRGREEGDQADLVRGSWRRAPALEDRRGARDRSHGSGIVESLCRGRRVTISGFWHVRRRQARGPQRARPRTGKEIKIPPARVPRFSPEPQPKRPSAEAGCACAALW